MARSPDNGRGRPGGQPQTDSSSPILTLAADLEVAVAVVRVLAAFPGSVPQDEWVHEPLCLCAGARWRPETEDQEVA